MNNDNNRPASNEKPVENWFSKNNESLKSSNQGLSSNDSTANSMAVLLHTIKENRWWIFLLMILGCIAGVIKAASETPIYQAKLTMAVEPVGNRSYNQVLFNPYSFRFYETQYELIKSRTVAERVVEELDLVERDSVQSLLVPPTTVRSLANEFKKLTNIDLLGVPKAVSDNRQLTDAELASKRAWLTSVIKNGVSVNGGSKTNLVTVTYRSINPDFAAEIANALVKAYIEEGLESQLNRSQQTTQWLSQRIDELRKTLDIAQVNLQSFLVQENLLDTTKNQQITTAELQSLNSEFISARSNFNELTKRYGSRHPKITEARAELIAAKNRLDRTSKTIASTREKQVELERLEQEVKSNRDLYEAFLNKFKEADLSNSGSQVASARIIDKALAPNGPVYPQKQKIIVTYTLTGLLLGLALVFLREQLDSRFKNGRMVEDKLGLPLFGILQSMPNIKTIERYYLENTRSVFAESINHIRTGVMYSNVDNPPKVLLVTSSLQSEGKTTLASNLALSYAQLGSTLLIDADLRRPRIKHIVDNNHSSKGLVELVAGVTNFDESIQHDATQKNLSILYSGTTPPNPLELIASERFEILLTELRSKFDYIIIDTAPVLPASDAVVLGRLCDSLLMVIQSEKTTHHMARDAIKRLNASNVHVDGLVLTQANLKKGSPYQYGGYYGYGAYSYVEDKVES